MTRKNLRTKRRALLTGVGSLFDLRGATTLRRVQDMMPPPAPRRSMNQILLDATMLTSTDPTLSGSSGPRD